MEPAEFLRSHPPFDRLGSEQLRSVESALEVAYYPRGSTILQQGGPQSRYLYVVRKGGVRLEREGRLLQVVEEGECFGFPSLIGRASPHVDVVTTEDTLAYQIPESVFGKLMQSGAFSEFFLADLSARLRNAADLEPPLDRDLAMPVRSLVTRPPVTVDAGETVQRAAQVMRDANVSSVLVPTQPPGILTDRDLRRKVLAEGRGPETPLNEVMSRPARTLSADASIFEALLFMLEQRVHHVPLEVDGAVIGIITDTDILRLQMKSPLHILRGLDRLDRAQVLQNYARELSAMVAELAAGGLDATKIAGIVSRLNDTLVAHLLRLAEAELGPPPSPYAWIVFGSEGRMEQALITDQDNALIYRDGGAEEEKYFEALAGRVVGGLIAASFPPCPGGFMATNWRRPLPGWVDLFRGWIDTPEPQALLEASSFFDFRAVHGGLGLEPLADLLRGAKNKQVFLAHLAKTALGFEPPLSPLRHIRDREGGVDLKRGGIMPIVGLARVFALEAGSLARPTIERLEAAAASGTLSPQGAATLVEAFRFLMRLRLRAQLRMLRRGAAPNNIAQLEDLSPLEQRHLKETFLAIREIQEATAMKFATNRLG